MLCILGESPGRRGREKEIEREKMKEGEIEEGRKRGREGGRESLKPDSNWRARREMGGDQVH